MKTRHIISCLIGALAAATLSSEAFAHDLTPPPWRDLTHPYTTLAEWDFNQPTNLTPDGNGVPLIVGNGLGGNLPTATMSGNIQWQPNSGGGGWLTQNDPAFISLLVPNWIDLEPLKKIRVQVSFETIPGVVPVGPTITSIVGNDNIVGPVVGVPGASALINVPPVPSFSYHWWQDWTMQPNPDWERITIAIPPHMFVDQIVVDTISTSIPEPSSIALIGLGLIGLGIAAMRKRK